MCALSSSILHFLIIFSLLPNCFSVIGVFSLGKHRAGKDFDEIEEEEASYEKEECLEYPPSHGLLFYGVFLVSATCFTCCKYCISCLELASLTSHLTKGWRCGIIGVERRGEDEGYQDFGDRVQDTVF